MSKSTVDNVGDGIEIHKFGSLITKVTKNGVVLWPQEPHNAGMLTESQLKELEVAKVRAWRQQEGVMRANDTMVGGNHYKSPDVTGQCPHCHGAIEHWDWSHNLRGLEYAGTKYLARWRAHSKPLESLKKVIHYVQKLIEIHFPDVVVTVSFLNKSKTTGTESSGQYNPRQSAAESSGSLFREAKEGERMVGSQTLHKEAVGSPDYEADRFPIGGRTNY